MNRTGFAIPAVSPATYYKLDLTTAFPIDGVGDEPAAIQLCAGQGEKQRALLDAARIGGDRADRHLIVALDQAKAGEA